MRFSHVRIALVILIIVALGLSSVASAAESEVQRLQAQIRGLQKDAERAGDAYSEAYWKLEKTRDRMAALDEQIADATAQLDAASARLSARAVQMYRSGGTDYLAILLSTDDFDEMLLRLEYVTRVGRQDADLIAEVTKLSADLHAKRAELEKVRDEQAQQATRLKKESDRVTRALRSTQADYNELQKKLKAAVARASGGSYSASRYAPGPNGMVFPVAGPCYYQDTWGAARSGGRSHQGTDIMAQTGTPLVACVSGTVRSKYHSLGGNSIWLTADNGWAFYYAHLSAYVVRSGRVQAGQVIGKVGSTGNATAPHLHFEIHPNGGSAVNPYPYLKAMQ